MNSTRPLRGLLAGAAFLLLAGAVCALRFEVTTSIEHFLPSGADRRLVQVSRAVADSSLTRTVVLSIGAEDVDRAAEAAGRVAERLAASPNVAWIRRGVDEDLRRAVHDLYFPRRLSLLSDAPERELPERLSDQGLVEALRELRRRLALPSSALVRPLAPADPLLAFPALLERLQAAQAGSLEVRAGQLVSKRGRGVVLLGSAASAFDTAGQRALQADIAAALAAARTDRTGPLDLEQSGAGRFAIAAERSIRSDITRISVLSSLGILLLFGALFRSLRALLLVALPLAAGMLGAAAAVLLISGRIHGLTLAFGATLIGVCIDYAVHLQCHHALAPDPGGPVATMRRIWIALVVGAATTVVGLAGLALTSLPGIREIAIFAVVGVTLSLGATRLLLPPLLGPATAPPPLLAALGRRLGRAIDAMAARRGRLAALPLLALALMAIALPRLRWRDDVRAFQVLDPDLRAEDERVRAEVSRMDAGRMILALGRDDAEALRRNDEAYLRLRAARDAGELEDFRSIHLLLPSPDLQRRNRLALEQAPDLTRRFADAMTREGFRPDAFRPFFDALEAPPRAPLTYDQLLGSPLADLVRPFRIRVGDEVAFLTFLRGVRDREALERRLDGLDGVLYFDQLEFLGAAWRESRSTTQRLMALGLLAVLLMVLVRYRRLGPALAAFIPALLAAGTTLAILTLAGHEATILHLLGLLLVLSMGVDYGVFMVESHERARELEATAVALVVACLSTVLAFGLLALSSNPAMRAMGLTTGIGVLSSLLFAPVALVLVGRRPPR